MKETNCGEMEAEHCLDSSMPTFYTPHPYDEGSLRGAVAAWMPSRRGGCQHGRLGAFLYLLKGWLMPDVREASVFLEEPDLSVKGGTTLPAEGRARGVSWSVAAKASGVPGNANKVQ